MLIFLITTLGGNIIYGNSLAPHLKFHKSRETLSNITNLIERKQKGVYFRFGDGDVNLAVGKADMLQKSNSLLQQEMREAFCINGPGVMKALILNCEEFGGYEEGMLPGKFLSSDQLGFDILRNAKLLWGVEIADVYSSTALHFTATDYPDEAIRFFRRLKQSNCTVFVGNENIPKHIRDVVLGPQCQFVPTPPCQSYEQIGRIEKECLLALSKTSNYQVAVIAMGCAGRVLQKRLWNKVDNVFLFDFGSLMDALCGWDTRAWIQLSNFDKDRFLSKLSKNIKLVYTSALIDKQFESRKSEYIYSINTLSSFWHKPYVIECCCKSETSFLNEYCDNVCYTQTNDARLKNKGVNEAVSLLKGLEYFKFSDDDMIVKLTGRYYFKSDKFFHLVEANPAVDAFVKQDSKGQVISGCFAMRCKYLKDMLRNMDFNKMEKERINIEFEVAQYLKKMKQVMKIKYVNNLGVIADIFGIGVRERVCW